jgi:hypothetical protein
MVSPTVDRRLGLVGNTAMKAPVTVVTTINITQSGEQTIDGVAVLAVNAAGVPDRVLCTGQTTASQNGIWDVSTGSWTRSLDCNASYDIVKGSTVLVTAGTTYVGTYWRVATSNPITIGTTSMAWERAVTGSLETLSFLQAGTGATPRTSQDKARERFSVKDFGAVGDGVTDDTAAIQATSDAITAARQTGSSGVAYGTAYDLLFTRGLYRVTSGITPPAYCSIIGEHAMLVAATNNFTVLQNLQFNTRVQGMGFVGGQKAIGVATGNVDTVVIDLIDCEFYNQTVSAVETDTSSNSTQLNVRGGKVYNTQAGATIFKIQTCDHYNIDGMWATVAGTFLQNGTASNRPLATLTNLCGVPEGGATVWVKNYGSITATSNRFGGEAAAVILKNYAGQASVDQNLVKFEGNHCYNAGEAAVEFYAIPNNFVWKDNAGFINGEGFYFDAAIPDLTSMRGYLQSWQVEGQTLDDTSLRGAVEPMVRATILRTHVARTGTLLVSDKVAQARANTATGGAAPTNVTVTNTTGDFGQPTRTYVGANAAYDGTISETWNNQLTGLATGTYTAVYEVEVENDHPAVGRFYGAESDTAKTLHKGKHLVNVPLYWNSATGTNQLGWAFDSLNNQQQVKMGSLRLFKGKIDVQTTNNILYADATPASLQWEVGDIIEKLTPTVGQAKRWRCTVAGLGGSTATFVSEGNL